MCTYRGNTFPKIIHQDFGLLHLSNIGLNTCPATLVEHVLLSSCRISCGGIFLIFLLEAPFSAPFLAVFDSCYPGNQRTFSLAALCFPAFSYRPPPSSCFISVLQYMLILVFVLSSQAYGGFLILFCFLRFHVFI